MRASAQRISHLAHLVKEALWKQDLVDYPDEARALDALKESLARQVAVEDEIDTFVRDKLTRQKKIPGSREWQILYDKYFREEKEKRG